MLHERTTGLIGFRFTFNVCLIIYNSCLKKKQKLIKLKEYEIRRLSINTARLLKAIAHGSTIYKTGIINDPLGQPTVPAGSDCRLILKFWD